MPQPIHVGHTYGRQRLIPSGHRVGTDKIAFDESIILYIAVGATQSRQV